VLERHCPGQIALVVVQGRSANWSELGSVSASYGLSQQDFTSVSTYPTARSAHVSLQVVLISRNFKAMPEGGLQKRKIAARLRFSQVKLEL
jgi:hypothetical protein